MIQDGGPARGGARRQGLQVLRQARQARLQGGAQQPQYDRREGNHVSVGCGCPIIFTADQKEEKVLSTFMCLSGGIIARRRMD